MKIINEKDYELALSILECLLYDDSKKEELGIISDMIYYYEAKYHPILYNEFIVSELLKDLMINPAKDLDEDEMFLLNKFDENWKENIVKYN